MSLPVIYSTHLYPVTALQIITILGKTTNTSQKLMIQLSASKNKSDFSDVPLRIAVNFKDTVPITITNGRRKTGIEWNRDKPKSFSSNSINPIQKNSDFKVSIYVDEIAYYVTINEVPFSTLAHQKQYGVLKSLIVSGDVEKIYHSNQMSTTPNQWPQHDNSNFESFAPTLFKPGTVIIITATTYGELKGNFIINFYELSNRDLAFFHFRPYPYWKVIVYDSQDQHGGWVNGIAIEPKPFPFNHEEKFRLAIAITKNSFDAAANGTILMSMKFRTPADLIFSSMTGFELVSMSGYNVFVHDVTYEFMKPDCVGFEKFSTLS